MTRQRSKSVSAPPARRAVAISPANGGDTPVKIGEAARIVGVEPYVLRFWETQFPFLRPRHDRSRHRHYDAEAIATLKIVKRLLHGEGFTIAGAKKHIRETGLDRLRGLRPGSDAPAPAPREESAPAERQPPAAMRRELAAIRDDLRSLRAILAR